MIFLIGLVYFVVIAFCIAFTIFLCMVPGIIAKSRGITDSERTTIIVLAWCGLLTMFITWWIALVLALVWHFSGHTLYSPTTVPLPPVLTIILTFF